MQAMQPTPRPATDEISRLQQQLAERELSAMRAILANSELESKVADAEEETTRLKAEIQKLQAQPSPADALAEIVRLKKEWSMTQKAQQREHAERRAELVRVRGLLHQAQKKYEDESRARRTENAQASGTIARLERDLGELRLAAKNIREEQTAQRKSHWRRTGAALVAMAAVCAGVVLWFPGTGLQPTPVAATPVSSASSIKRPDLPSPFAPGTGPEFSSALSRLNDLLAAFPNRAPEDVLREVHLSRIKEEPDLCAFQWNGGQPSLLFNHDRPNASIASSLNRCAQAVDAWKTQKNAPASPPGH